MTHQFSLDQLTLESAAPVLGDEPIRAEAALANEEPNPTLNKEYEDLLHFTDVYGRIVSRGSVCREDIESIAGYVEDYPALRKLLERYPVNSFTAEPSRVNLEVSTESFIKTAFTAVVNALKDVIRFIINVFKSIWDFLTQNRARTQAVDDIAEKLTAIQTYLQESAVVMSETSLAEDYSAWMRRTYDTQIHNLNKTWDELKNMSALDQPRVRGYLDKLASTVIAKLPPFADGLEQFLSDLKDARSQQELKTAILKMNLVDMTSSALTTLASDLGFNPTKIKKDPRITNFQAQAIWVRNALRSWNNERSATVTRENINDLIFRTDVQPWAQVLDNAMNLTKKRVDSAMKGIMAFNEREVDPSLKQTAVDELTPFLTALSSIIQGLAICQQCIGMLVTARDNATIAICRAALAAAKSSDGYIMKNKDKLSIGQMTIIRRHRTALQASFGTAS